MPSTVRSSDVKDTRRPQEEHELVTTFHEAFSFLPFGLLGLDPWGLWWENVKVPERLDGPHCTPSGGPFASETLTVSRLKKPQFGVQQTVVACFKAEIRMLNPFGVLIHAGLLAFPLAFKR